MFLLCRSEDDLEYHTERRINVISSYTAEVLKVNLGKFENEFRNWLTYQQFFRINMRIGSSSINYERGLQRQKMIVRLKNLKNKMMMSLLEKKQQIKSRFVDVIMSKQIVFFLFMYTYLFLLKNISETIQTSSHQHNNEQANDREVDDAVIDKIIVSKVIQ